VLTLQAAIGGAMVVGSVILSEYKAGEAEVPEKVF
jgi:hypothetical protein